MRAAHPNDEAPMTRVESDEQTTSTTWSSDAILGMIGWIQGCPDAG